ncbi:ATP-binding protein [Amycolatopsis sp. NPDC005961]|uniref:Histidine kinase/HSP90-like ATPase domain-containing protein n=1 Tax=Amycolatopsis camponoti TaxID=2606593 RepID=A0A6I8LKH1_9PSEU|nr:ATP-binding protein [Amycolatopsis camponoti]VVJ17551.1 Uncharacterised protein [Amycolatopsis camponoti]
MTIDDPQDPATPTRTKARCVLVPGDGPESPGRTRAWTRWTLRQVSPDLPEDRVTDVLLVVDELMSNAVLHGGGCRHVVLAVETDRVVVKVADHSPALAYVPAPDVRSVSGMRMVGDGASTWGQAVDDAGKTVWAVVRLG